MIAQQNDTSFFEGTSMIPSNVLMILKRLKDNNAEAFLVGGCVRDGILMRHPHDYDIATNILLEDVAKLFPNAKILGKSFGVLKVEGVDIATYRIDGKYSDHRHPDSVTFVKDIVQDLSRRDFTMNAIAFDGERYIDPFNGMDAIRRGIIQTVNSPKIRFTEDPLRMLRAFRFSSVLGYNISNSTFKAIRELKSLIREISKERVRCELLRMMSGKHLLGALFSMSASGLMFELLPDMAVCKGYKQNKYHRYDVLEHSFRVANAVPKEKPLLRFAAFLHDMGKPVTCANYGTDEASFHNHEFIGADMAVTVLQALTFSNKEVDYITNMIRAHMFGYRQEMKNSAIRRLIRRVGMENIRDLMQLKYADRVGNGLKEFSEFTWDTSLMKRIEQIDAEKSAFTRKDLAINGNDLKELEIGDGKFMGFLLKACLDTVLENPELNTKEALISLVKTIILEYNKDKVGELNERKV